MARPPQPWAKAHEGRYPGVSRDVSRQRFGGIDPVANPPAESTRYGDERRRRCRQARCHCAGEHSTGGVEPPVLEPVHEPPGSAMVVKGRRDEHPSVEKELGSFAQVVAAATTQRYAAMRGAGETKHGDTVCGAGDRIGGASRWGSSLQSRAEQRPMPRIGPQRRSRRV